MASDFSRVLRAEEPRMFSTYLDTNMPSFPAFMSAVTLRLFETQTMI